VTETSRGPHRVGVTHSSQFLPEEGSRDSFRNVVLLRKKHWTMDAVQKQDSSIQSMVLGLKKDKVTEENFVMRSCII
jgi:hypothetical protein